VPQLHLTGRARWGKLTGDDLERIAGERDQLIGKLDGLYGLNEDSRLAAARFLNLPAPEGFP
jgi:uncharacterized protein YjbJ (UPF0337 family)